MQTLMNKILSLSPVLMDVLAVFVVLIAAIPFSCLAYFLQKKA